MIEKNGRVAVVTGVTGKFGRGIARGLALRGWSVVGTGRRKDRGLEFEKALTGEGADVLFVQGDVSRVEDCEQIVEATVRSYGRVDLLVNNAATLTWPPFIDTHDLVEENYDQVMDTNLKGTFYMSAHALRAMVGQRSGNIVNIASAHGQGYGPPRMSAYVASKAGVIALTKTLSQEYAERGIRVNAVVLGAAEGDAAYHVEDQRGKERLGDGYEPAPFDERDTGRITGEYLAATIEYLAGEDSRHMNGSAVTVDQGLSAGGYWKWVAEGIRTLTAGPKA
ncbi:SDR family NAD(P)-dependent oxidoreductase [Cryptosporangium sp. NPDC051539]|uniref:SDR family NAD(P)-dependent oxidoreductase n=1 Tax=Cryptosporangium sp. NPDC051539 TaxID=3363962 RepID=UPI00379D86B2